MTQTMQLNKEELEILSDLAYENGYFALSDKLIDFLMDMKE